VWAGADGVLYAEWDAMRVVGFGNAALVNILVQPTLGDPCFGGPIDVVDIQATIASF
jgi:hypothetical protein